jgi:glucokinase
MHMRAAAVSWAVGADIGGTNVRVAEVSGAGVPGCVLAEPLDPDRAGGSPFGQLIEMIGTLIEKADSGPPAGIGVGATGPVDPERGVISNSHTLPEPYRGPVTGALSDAFGLPVRLENDADAAALGEAWVGAGAGAELVACVTAGTGIGCGLVRRGAIVRGARGGHPEFGHHVVDPSGPVCYCGSHGCVESLASARAIARAATAAGAIAAGDDATEVFARSARDAGCRAVVERARSALAAAVLNLVAIVAPDVVVLTGNGLGDPAAQAELIGVIRNRLDDFLFTPPGGVRVCLSRLRGMAGCIGAARLAFQPGAWS